MREKNSQKDTIFTSQQHHEISTFTVQNDQKYSIDKSQNTANVFFIHVTRCRYLYSSYN